MKQDPDAGVLVSTPWDSGWASLTDDFVRLVVAEPGRLGVVDNRDLRADWILTWEKVPGHRGADDRHTPAADSTI